MKELTRKVIPDDYDYTYKNKTVKKKRWRVIFEYVHRSGEIKFHKPSFKTKKKAEQELNRLIKKESDEGFFVADKDQVLLRTYAEDYKKAMLDRLAPTSHANEIARVDEAVNFFYHKTITSIIRKDVKDYKVYLKQKTAKNAKKIEVLDAQKNKKLVSPKLSDVSVKKYLSRFRAMLNEARRDYGLPAVDYFVGDIMPKNKKGREKVIDFFEFDRLLQACTGKQARLKLLFITLWESGRRYSEVVGNEKNIKFLPGLKRRDIDFNNRRISFWNSKLHPGSEPEQTKCYLSEFLSKALIEAGVDKLNPDDLIFKRGDFRDSWKKILSVAGIDEDFWIKDFRHCFSTNADEAGVRSSAIQYQMNHAGDSLLEKTYINVKDNKLTKAFEPFERYSKEQRAMVEAKKQKPVPKPKTETEWDFSFLPTFKNDSPKPKATN